MQKTTNIEANIKNKQGQTPLHLAKTPSEIDSLIKAEAKFLLDKAGNTCLHHYAETLLLENIKYLVESYKVDKDRSVKANDMSQLINHVNANHETILHILARKFYQTRKDYRDKTITHLLDLLELTTFLIDNGAKLDIFDNNGNTAIHNIYIYGFTYIGIREFSVKQDTDKEQTQIKSLTKHLFEQKQLHRLANKNGQSILHCLLLPATNSTGAIIDSQTRNLFCELVDLFLAAGFDINSVDNKQQTLLHLAVALDATYIVEFLLQKKDIDIFLQTIDGDQPIHYVKSTTMCNLLVQKGADINAQNHCGNTILHMVCFKSMDTFVTPKNDLIKELINCGAKNEIQNIANDFPLCLIRNAHERETITAFYNKFTLVKTAAYKPSSNKANEPVIVSLEPQRKKQRTQKSQPIIQQKPMQIEQPALATQPEPPRKKQRTQKSQPIIQQKSMQVEQRTLAPQPEPTPEKQRTPTPQPTPEKQTAQLTPAQVIRQRAAQLRKTRTGGSAANTPNHIELKNFQALLVQFEQHIVCEAVFTPTADNSRPS